MGNRKWRTYEEVAAYLFNMLAGEFGVSFFEGKQTIPGVISKTEWEIDAKGVREGDGGFLIVECKRYMTSTIKQEQIAGLAWRIIDTGAFGGISVTPLGYQEGAKKVAGGAGIFTVRLTADSSPDFFVVEFLDKFKVVAGMTMSISGGPPIHSLPSP